mgnify:CR=1 FL=1
MKILGIDTSGYVNAVGVCENGRVLAEGRYPAKTDSLEQIVDNIETTLNHAGLSLADIDGFGVGLGPGSWTGIRVGVTVGKTLAFSTGKPACGISTLDALGFVGRDHGYLVAAVISVGAGDAVYAGFYHAENGAIGRLGDYYTGSVEGLAAFINRPTVVIAHGARDYAGRLSGHTTHEVVAVEARPYGSAMACLASARLERGEQDDVLSLSPMYLKESTAKAYINKYAPKPEEENS